MSNTPLFIISADDDADDQDLLSEALHKTGKDFRLECVSNGGELIRLLFELQSAKANMPDFLLLDLNMPVKNGREVLLILEKSDKVLRNIPIAILSTSNAAEDREFCMKHGASAFFVKPNRFHDLVSLVHELIRLFLRIE